MGHAITHEIAHSANGEVTFFFAGGGGGVGVIELGPRSSQKYLVKRTTCFSTLLFVT